jgi:hypothetical protein
MLRATLNQAVPLQVLAADGRTDLFARATLYANEAVLTVLTLPHIASGLYGTNYTPDAEGYISAVYELFFDSGFTAAANYDLESEMMEVSSDKTNILRILGLLHENTVFDNQVYDSGGNLVSGRLRAYDTKSHALTAGLPGLLFTWAVSASYTGGQLSQYLITREP